MSPNLKIPSALQERLDELALFSDRTERIEYLIEISHQYDPLLGQNIPRDEAHRVPGCESEVYISSLIGIDGDLDFIFAVDNPQGLSAMALSAILVSGLKGASREEIQAIPEEMVLQIFGNELSMGKSLGLTNIVRTVKQLADSSLR